MKLPAPPQPTAMVIHVANLFSVPVRIFAHEEHALPLVGLIDIITAARVPIPYQRHMARAAAKEFGAIAIPTFAGPAHAIPYGAAHAFLVAAAEIDAVPPVMADVLAEATAKAIRLSSRVAGACDGE